MTIVLRIQKVKAIYFDKLCKTKDLYSKKQDRILNI